MILDTINSFVSNIAQGIFTFVFHLVFKIVNVVLEPLNYLIETTIPGLSSIVSLVGAFFTWLSDLIPWVVSYLGLSQEILNLIVIFITFRITTTLSVNIIKFSLNWYRSLK